MEIARKPATRRFTIADGMILIGFTAVGLAWTARVWRIASWMDKPPETWGQAWNWLVAFFALAMPCLLFWTLAVSVLRMRTPRPSRRRITRQPGMTACLAATLGLVPFVLIAIIFIWQEIKAGRAGGDYWVRIPAGLLEMLEMGAPSIGLVVLIAWVLLVIQGRWRRERGWIDRAGLFVGVAWIVSGGVFGVVWVTQHLS